VFRDREISKTQTLKLKPMPKTTVFSQVIKLIPRTRFESFVEKHKGDFAVKKLDCWTWFGSLLFGQLTGHDSIRALERVFSGGEQHIQKLGFGRVRKSTLADANKTRPVAILEDTFAYLLETAKKIAPNKPGFRFKGDVFAVDSSTINLCLNMCPWARFHHGKGAFKLHTAVDIAGDLPEFAVLTEARLHDVRLAKSLKLQTGATYLFDRAYVDYDWLSDLNQQGTFFVTRAKKNCSFKVYKSRSTNRTRGHICDQIIYLRSPQNKKKAGYKGKLRRIRYHDPDTGKKFVFLTNRFDLATQTICDLYKARWRVENFFKAMKQNLKIKKFLGTSVNAVKAQVMVALIAYLLIQIIRFGHRTSVSITDTIAVIGTLLLLYQPISKLLGSLPCTTRYPPDSQLCLNL
jgi:hypothetical protein